MIEKITTVRLDGTLTLRERSSIMKKVFAHLFSTGGITYSQFLFPYADSLLLSDDSDECFFGSHALLWQLPPERLMYSFDEICGDRSDVDVYLDEIELTAASVKSFLGEPQAAESCISIGNYAALLSGSIRPWTLREHSRCLCSFAEHIARMKGYTVHGFSGGCLVIEAENADLDQLTALYASKTGGIADFTKF